MTATDRAVLFAALAELARRYPNWRAGQLVANVAGWADAEVWDVEDGQLLAAARDHLRASVVQQFPAGWDEARVRALIGHYDSLSDDDLAAEDEAAYEAAGMTLMAIPAELVPEVNRLLANYKKPA